MSEQQNLEDILFYSLERSIKSYRQFAQQQLIKKGFEITIDQWLLLKTVHENPGQTQNQIAQTIFKDFASVTRMVELLVERKYIFRNPHPTDRRRFHLKLSEVAVKLLDNMQLVIENNRRIALKNISEQQILQFQQVLDVIYNNCTA
ncbi:MarR family winged helix-turn-helix transcriptional regulator [Pedobacter sp. WC2423]|uniref:MarR family winged helix-turn-helix transcriptional regulator n=1 Tax=Pedobacter sp. WC2423 TaxID=3234142 RepID=UPI003465D2E1